MMQSTKPASIDVLADLRPRPDWLEDMEPFASTNPAAPRGAKWYRKCCTQAKLALPTGGTPYSQRLSSLSRSPRPSQRR